MQNRSRILKGTQGRYSTNTRTHRESEAQRNCYYRSIFSKNHQLTNQFTVIRKSVGLLYIDDLLLCVFVNYRGRASRLPPAPVRTVDSALP